MVRYLGTDAIDHHHHHSVQAQCETWGKDKIHPPEVLYDVGNLAPSTIVQLQAKHIAPFPVYLFFPILFFYAL
jgi:hypothetical protein